MGSKLTSSSLSLDSRMSSSLETPRWLTGKGAVCDCVHGCMASIWPSCLPHLWHVTSWTPVFFLTHVNLHLMYSVFSSLLYWSSGQGLQVPPLLAVCVPWHHAGEEKVWRSGLQHPLRVYWWWPQDLHQSAQHVPERVRGHPIQGTVHVCSITIRNALSYNTAAKVIKWLYSSRNTA